MQELVSLKSNCRSRLETQICPSLSQKSFLMGDFMSKEFVDSLLAHYDKMSLKTPRHDMHSLNRLNTLIEQAHQTFEAIVHQIKTIETGFIQKLTSFYTADFLNDHPDDQKETLYLLQVEMKRCHQKILESHLADSRLIDEFASLLSKFEPEKNKMEHAFTVEEKALEVSEQIDYIRNELQSALLIVLQNNSKVEIWKPRRIIPHKPSEKPSPQVYQTRKLVTLEVNLDNYFCSSTVVDAPNHDYVLFAMQGRNSLAQTIIIDTHKSKVISASKNLYDGVEVYTNGKNFLYSHSLNMFISGCHRYREESPAIRLYKPNAKGMIKRVADIPMNTFFPDKRLHDFLYFEIEQPQNLLIIACDQTLKLINLLTRSIVQTFTFGEVVTGVRCIKDPKFVVVVLTNRFLVYELVDRLLSSSPKFDMPLMKRKWNNTYFEANVLVTEKFVFNVIRDPQGNVIEDASIHKFVLFQINRKGINKYKASVLSCELYENVYQIDAQQNDQDPPVVDVGYLIIHPNSNKLKILYSFRGSDDLSSKEIAFKSCEKVNKYVKQDIVLQTNGPFVYNLVNQLYMDKLDI